MAAVGQSKFLFRPFGQGFHRTLSGIGANFHLHIQALLTIAARFEPPGCPVILSRNPLILFMSMSHKQRLARIIAEIPGYTQQPQLAAASLFAGYRCPALFPRREVCPASLPPCAIGQTMTTKDTVFAYFAIPSGDLPGILDCGQLRSVFWVGFVEGITEEEGKKVPMQEKKLIVPKALDVR